jgi:hypothetical protein
MTGTTEIRQFKSRAIVIRLFINFLVRVFAQPQAKLAAPLAGTAP